jgi:hypothetical protein
MGAFPNSLENSANRARGSCALQQAFRRMNQDRYTSSLEDRQIRYAVSHIVKNIASHHITNGSELEHPFLIVYTVTCDDCIKDPKVTGDSLSDPAMRRRSKD